LHIFIVEEKNRKTISESSLKIAIFTVEKTVYTWFKEK
jgi:hypothetical protein